MRWPWQHKDRGTLTFLRDGSVIIGVPDSATQEEVHHAREMIGDWIKERRAALVLPWPVDVIDQRPKP